METRIPQQAAVGGDGGWRDRFHRRAGRHRAITSVDTGDLGQAAAEALGRSLSTFQVGESGTGEHLFAAAEAAGVDDDYLDALGSFVGEEQEHARLLAVVLDAMEVPLRSSHWTDRVFVAVRRVKSLRAEVLTLLVAEVIALRYYSALRDGIECAPLGEVFARIHEDEVMHVDFHAETLPVHLHRFSPPVFAIVRLLWNTLVTVTSILVALDHTAALRQAGLGRRRFVADVWALRSELDDRLFGGRGPAT
ncbi:MAG: ferritin-like domain-containing protein [Acidimicrobiia bacterium]|nr:ferritin-like domain-containing protein [Acidimicrobiia bacterium]